MMKRTTYKGMFAALMVAMAGFTSCSFEDDDYFDESASLRVENFNKEVKKTLVGSEHGWVMQYYTGTQKYHFEGFNLFAKFYDSNKVLMAGNHRMLRNGNANKYTEDESIYTMLQEDGPVLSFSTWNNILNVFADPVNPFMAPTQIENDGAGMNGDYNFVVASCDEDEIRLIGERYQANVRLIKCDRPWQEYIKAIDDNKKAITNTSINSYYVTNAIDTLYFTGIRGGRVRYSERLNDPLQNDSLACCFTPDGFCFEKEDTIGDIPFRKFRLNEEKTMLLSENGQVQCIAMWDTYVVSHKAVWKFDDTQFTPELASTYKEICDAIKAYNKNYIVESIGIGSTTVGNKVNGLVISFYTNASKKSINTCGMSIDMKRTAFGQMSYMMPAVPRKDSNFTNFAKNVPALETATKKFIALIQGIYNITPNDYFMPDGATYTAVDGGLTFILK